MIRTDNKLHVVIRQNLVSFGSFTFFSQVAGGGVCCLKIRVGAVDSLQQRPVDADGVDELDDPELKRLNWAVI